MTTVAVQNEMAKVAYERKPKVERVPLKLSAVHVPAECQLNDDAPKELGEPIVIMITAGSMFQQLTVSHPVGFHKLAKSDWIVTPTSEVQSLLASAVDPSKDKKSQVREIIFKEMALTKNHYVKIGEKLAYPPNIWGGKFLSEVATHAEKAWKAAAEDDYKSYVEECIAKNRKPLDRAKRKFGQAVEGFYPAAVREYDRAFRETLKTDKEYQDKLKAIPEYETLTGPQGDISQSAAVVYAGARTKEQMVDVIKRDLVTGLNGTRVACVPRAAVISRAYSDAKDDPTKLKDFIFEFCFPFLRGYTAK